MSSFQSQCFSLTTTGTLSQSAFRTFRSPPQEQAKGERMVPSNGGGGRTAGARRLCSVQSVEVCVRSSRTPCDSVQSVKVCVRSRTPVTLCRAAGTPSPARRGFHCGELHTCDRKEREKKNEKKHYWDQFNIL